MPSSAPVVLFAAAFAVALPACQRRPAPPTKAPQGQPVLDAPRPSPRKQTQAPEPELPKRYATLCHAKDAALADARAKYDALDALVQALQHTDSTAAFNEQATALYNHECFAVARLDHPFLSFEATSGLDAKTYWDAGLGIWFQSYLDLADGSDNTVWFPPSHRRVVVAALMPDDPLAPWMCPPHEYDDCGPLVGGWRARAQRYFDLSEPSAEAPDCRELIEVGQPMDAYARWRDCERDAMNRSHSLPVGGVGPVQDGWLVVYGRRGHYQYCDELAVYDLESGSHYRFAECENRPEIQGVAQPPPSGVQTDVGTIPAALLRETVWASASARYVQPNIIGETALGSPLPEGVEVRRVEEDLGLTGFGRGFGYHSGQTTLTWAWLHPGTTPEVRGELTWPDSSDPPTDHAVRLLAIAESQRTPGCAPAKLPAWLSETVASLEGDDAPSEPLRRALVRQSKRGRCGPPSPQRAVSGRP